MAQLEEAADKLVRYAKELCPEMQLHELGAFLTSSGVFLIASSIPDLWPRLRGTAELSHQLLLNKEQNNGQAKLRNDQQAASDC